MPEISFLGWIHTVLGIIALVSGIYAFIKHKIIHPETKSGALYLACTFMAAASALAIFRHGGFGVAHALAVLTLLALIAGLVATYSKLLGAFSAYFQTICFSATYLFHMIPAITDGLMRLPTDDPIVKSIEDPLLKQFYLAFLVAYLVGVTLQILWLRKQSATSIQSAKKRQGL